MCLKSVDGKSKNEKALGKSCFLCKKPGHFIADCFHSTLHNSQKKNDSKDVSLAVKQEDKSVGENCDVQSECSNLNPFKSDGWVSASENGEIVHVRMLRDTGSSKSMVIRNRIPFIEETLTGNSVILHGLGREPLVAPLARIYLRLGYASKYVEVAVIEELPVGGVCFLVGNDIAGSQIVPDPVVKFKPLAESPTEELERKHPGLFPAEARLKL